jgi:hypothetical protein
MLVHILTSARFDQMRNFILQDVEQLVYATFSCHMIIAGTG